MYDAKVENYINRRISEPDQTEDTKAMEYLAAIVNDLRKRVEGLHRTYLPIDRNPSNSGYRDAG